MIISLLLYNNYNIKWHPNKEMPQDITHESHIKKAIMYS